MEYENSVLNELARRFGALDVAGAKLSRRRIFLDVPGDIFNEVLRCAANELNFSHLCTITGLDVGDELEFIYHIANNDTGIVLNLKRRIPKADPQMQSVLPIFKGAVFYERELEGLLGVKITGLPKGRQYPLPDNWPKGQYPLRKDWTAEKLNNTDEGGNENG